jgi:lysophospholipase L1-like esterase
MIKVFVQKTMAKADIDTPLTSGSVGLEVEFVFSEDWSGLTKTAVFETSSFYKETVPLSTVSTIVPADVMAWEEETLYIGVYGTAQNGEIVIPTVYANCGRIHKGANDSEGGRPLIPAQSDILQNQIDSLGGRVAWLEATGGGGGSAGILLDTTLTQSGKAADAKAVGDALKQVSGGQVIGRFFGKVANFLGDSQTDNAGNYKSVFFYDWLKDILGLSVTNSYGYSGTTIMPIAGQNRSFLERYSSMADADLIVVWGGTNDYHYGHALGEVDDTVNTTFCGALNQLCKGLITKYPQKDILFVTPTPRGVISSAVAPLSDYADAIINVCAKYCIPVYDAFRKCNMPINYEYPRKYTVDGLHLNDLGHEVLGKSMANFILYSEMAGAQTAWSVSEDSGETEVTLTGIAATYSGGDVPVGTALTALTGLVVTATYSDGSTTPVTGYNLSGSIGEGNNTITVSYGGMTTTFTVTGVTSGSGQGGTSVSVTGVTLDKSTHSINVGESVQLTATVVPSDATNKNVSWSANNGNCTVSNGLVTAVTAGDCTITATTEDGGFTASCAIAVSEPAADAPASPVDGKTVTFTAAGSYPAGVNNLTLLVNGSDFVFEGGETATVVMNFADATQSITGSPANKAMQSFQDETGSLNNGAFKTPGVTGYMASTVSGNTLTASAGTGDSVTYPYVKIPVPIVPAAYPVSFKIESLTLDINGTYIPIQAVGGFYAQEGYSES